MDAGAGPRASRSLGLDVGATNLKWAIVEHGPLEDCWTTIARDQVATRIAAEPDRVPAGLLDQLVDVAVGAAAAEGRSNPLVLPSQGGTTGPGGEIRFLPNVAGSWAGLPVAGTLAGARRAGGADQRCARLRAGGLRLGAGRGATSMIGLTLGTGVGGVIAIDGRVVQGLDGSAGEIGHQTLDGRASLRVRQSRLSRGLRPRGPDRIGLRHVDGGGSREPGRATRRWMGSPPSEVPGDRYRQRGDAGHAGGRDPRRRNGGGRGSADGRDREEIGRRVRMTSVDDLRIVAAELGTWAGAIGAAVHGAEAAFGPSPLVAR